LTFDRRPALSSVHRVEDRERRDRFDAEYSQRVTANERRIARVGVVVAIAGGLASIHVTLVLHQVLGLTLIALALVYGCYAGLLVPRLLRRESWLVWVQRLNVTASIRWRPWLALYAGVVGAVEQGGLYLLYLQDLTPEAVADLPSLSTGHAVQRMAYLLIAGMLAGVAAQVGRSIAERVVSQLLDQERVRRLFGEYVSEQEVDRVLRGDRTLGGERRQVTVLFADIRGFTSLSSELAPEEVVRFLNRYFAAVSQVIANHGGMVNKFMGDGLLAVFGAPEPHPDHARRALRAAWDMVEVARGVVRPRGAPTAIGVGLHTGELVLGSIGSPHHRDYTVIGDTVNVAARVEGLTRELEECVLCTAETQVAAGDAAGDAAGELVSLGERQVKGRREPVQLYALRAAPQRVRSASTE